MMKRLLVLSWFIVVLAFISVTFGLVLESGGMLTYAIGYALGVMPQTIWILASNRITAKALDKPPSRLISALAITIPGFAFITHVTLLGRPVGLGQTVDGSGLVPLTGSIYVLSLLGMLVALILSIILVSRQIVDAQDHPRTGRGSRIFVLCICFFYVLIGMFFIAPKLKKIAERHGKPALR